MMNLKFYKGKSADLFCSPEILRGEGSDSGSHILSKIEKEIVESPFFLEQIELSTIEYFIKRNDNYRQLIELNARKFRLPGRKAILHAHGVEESSYLTFISGKKDYSAQSWVNKQDGKYSALMLHLCNPDHFEIKSKKSAVLVPNETYSKVKHDSGLVKIELYLPEIGYIDSYQEEAIIKDFKKSLRNNI